MSQHVFNGSRTIDGLAVIANEYDVVALDQFGVLHDGSLPYAGAVRALTGLRATGKRIVVLTNSGKRAIANAHRLAEMGFAADAFDAVVSSGETAWSMINASTLGAPFQRGASTCIIGKSGDDYGFDGLDLRFVTAPADADFLLILGSDAPTRSLETQVAALASAAARRIPALCANPDLTMLTRHGHQPAPGAIAAGYAALGGTVRYLGKPYPDIYAEIVRLAAGSLPARILAVGDSLAHDVAGAARAGFGTALVRTGVSLGLDDAALTGEMARTGTRPDYVLAALDW
jgi:HAD superfamily hydrolase (TIGR01459 family)